MCFGWRRSGRGRELRCSVEEGEEVFEFGFGGAAAVFAEFEGFGEFDRLAAGVTIRFDHFGAVAVGFAALPEMPAALEPGAARGFVVGRRDIFFDVLGAAAGSALISLRGEFVKAVDFLGHLFLRDRDGDAGGEGVGFLEAVAGIHEDGVFLHEGDVRAEEGNGDHEGCILDQDADIAMIGMVVPGPMGDDEVGIPLTDHLGDEFAVFEGGKELAVVDVEHLGSDTPFGGAGFGFGVAALGEFAAGVAPVADVAIGDGAEFDVVAEFGPFDGGAAGFVFGVVGVGSENDDAEFAVGFGGGEQGGGDEKGEEEAEHGEGTSKGEGLFKQDGYCNGERIGRVGEDEF